LWLKTIAAEWGEARLIGLVNEAATHDWRAAIALLERIAPFEYAKSAPPQSVASPLIGGDDGWTIHELLLRETASRSPDRARIERLKKTLEEVRNANAELLQLIQQWTAEPYDRVINS